MRTHGATAVVRSAIRIYFIAASAMFVGGALAGAALAIAGYDITHLF